MFDFIRKLFGIPEANEVDDYYGDDEYEEDFQEVLKFREELEEERKKRERLQESDPVMDYIIYDDVVNSDETKTEDCSSSYLDLDTSDMDWNGSSDNYDYDSSDYDFGGSFDYD